MKVQKNLLIIVSTLSIIILAICLRLVYSNYIYGDPKEREQLLLATIYHLSEQDITKEDIIKIKSEYEAFSGGVYPFGYDVLVITKDNPDEIKYYIWKDKQKTKVVQAGIARK